VVAERERSHSISQSERERERAPWQVIWPIRIAILGFPASAGNQAIQDALGRSTAFAVSCSAPPISTPTSLDDSPFLLVHRSNWRLVFSRGKRFTLKLSSQPCTLANVRRETLRVGYRYHISVTSPIYICGEILVSRGGRKMEVRRTLAKL